MDYGYVRDYMSHNGCWDFSNCARNERIKDNIKGTLAI